jgi:glutathione synthase/RimK-type ligase-like ATP-grasp enzyme
VAVLIIAQENDPHTQAVARELEALGRTYAILDLSDFPQLAKLNIRYTCCGDASFEITIADRAHDLGHFDAAWWRRPQLPRISEVIPSEAHRLFAANEVSEALAGLWHALDAFWVNDPALDHVAHRKVTQLQVARRCGFRLPDTLISNDPDEVRVFVDQHGYRKVAYKAFSALEDQWRETRVLQPQELSLLGEVRHAPVIFQEYIEAVYDLRITLVGDAIFAAAIHSQETSYPVDFRMDMANAQITPIELPADLEERLHAYRRALGLEYGAVDMRLRPDGEYVFLEINPAGQWLFVEEKTQQPIAAALARLLTTHGTRANRVADLSSLKESAVG